MAALILHPFSIRISGAVATAEQGSDEYIDSQIAVIVGTRLGERPMCEPFGVPDAGFSRLAVNDIQTTLDRFGPDGVRVTRLDVTRVDEVTDDAHLTWERAT